MPVAVVLRDLGLGDLLVAVPALRLLRRALPGHRIVLVAPPSLAPLVARIEAVDEHVPDERAVAAPVDIAVNLHGRGPQSHARLDVLAPHRRVGHAAPGWEGPAWTEDMRRSERRRWCGLLAACGLVDAATARHGADDLRLPRPLRPTAARPTAARPTAARPTAPRPTAPRPTAARPTETKAPFAASSAANGAFDPPAAGPVVVHPGAAYGSKRWPAERFAVCAAALHDRGYRVVVTGGEGERALTAAVVAAAGLDPDADLGGRTDLAGLLDLVAGAALVLAGDTGISHVATAFGTPSVTLFGPVPPSQWGPPPAGPHVVLTDDAVRRGERFADDPDPALLAVTPADVLAAIPPVLGAR